MTPCAHGSASSLLILLAFTAVALHTNVRRRYDVLIRNGRVLDGSGNPWIATDIGIRGGRIVDMGRLGERRGVPA